MVKTRLITALLALLAISRAAAIVDTMTGVFDPSFKSLQVTVNDNAFLPPIVVLDSDDYVTVSFDELADDRSYLRYSLTHCNADWQPSQLVESEFVEGFNLGDVDTYDYSRMALTNYIHYSITLPNSQVRFTVSGNYLLRVFPENDPDAALLQVRFMVSESTAAVTGGIHTVTDIDYNDAHQQLAIEVDATNTRVDDVFNDLRVYVAQNGRLDNEVMLRHPLRAAGAKAIYEHQPQLIFEAGNEYRRFENVSTHYPGMGVEMIEYFEPYYNMTLATDYPRAQASYLYDQTQNGRYFVREYNSDRSDIEADYVITHFALEMAEMPDRMVFIDGDMVNRRFDPESLMVYNRATGRYEKSMLLKQGAYNYQYLVTRPGSYKAETAPIEGDYYQTRNEYLVKVYTRLRGDRYDRLIGAGVIRNF